MGDRVLFQVVGSDGEVSPSAVDIYLDWVNNWLTVARMAEHYNLTESVMRALIQKGRQEHERRVGADRRTH